MKKLVVASLALLAASLAGAADIALKDNRVLRDAVVVRHDAATVTFRHATGFSQIEKPKLPESLAAEYPFDPAQAKLEAQRQQQEVQARRAEAERLLALRVQLAAAAPKPVEAPTYVEPKQDNAPTPTWADNYNTESWRLMRIRSRNRDRDHDCRGDRDRHADVDNRRYHDRTPRTPHSGQTAWVKPEARITPASRPPRSDSIQHSDTPPETTKQWGQRPRRF